jgi:hypothetical protein
MSSNFESNYGRQSAKWAVAVRDHDEALERRKFSRVPVEGIRTRLGDVVDLTPAGMRIITDQFRLAQREVLCLELTYPEGSLQVTGRTVWVKKLSRRRHEMGIAFEDVTAATRTVLAQLAPQCVTVALPQA